MHGKTDRRGRLTCSCGGYEFTHRKGGGACIHNPDSVHATVLLMQRQGAWPVAVDDATELLVDMVFAAKPQPVTVCPF
jgi:hypothetical protein